MATHKVEYVVMVLMCMAVVGALITTAEVDCGQVVSFIAPCINYLMNGGAVPGECCNGVKKVVLLAQTTADKQTACNCLKAQAAAISTFKNANAEALPAKCGVNLPYKISSSTNCNNIKF
ncbi:putative plant lipid transfer protein/Par allergen [Lupinus albus]|uniref:Non-specific lipid-transfer protein n=1 Tax=Lupinus albus TaxID=3870 RepID=A0A6A4PNV1_LUPAL|nr:putative plant lipid transfer protein/Par allergen [Lupinus albus]